MRAAQLALMVLAMLGAAAILVWIAWAVLSLRAAWRAAGRRWRRRRSYYKCRRCKERPGLPLFCDECLQELLPSNGARSSQATTHGAGTPPGGNTS